MKRKRKPEIRRRVMREKEGDGHFGDLALFTTASFTIPEGVYYHPAIDLKTREFHCNCPDNTYRHNFCKHLERAAIQLIKKKELPRNFLSMAGVKCCFGCGSKGIDPNEPKIYPMCNEDLTPTDNIYICPICADKLYLEEKEKKNVK